MLFFSSRACLPPSRPKFTHRKVWWLWEIHSPRILTQICVTLRSERNQSVKWGLSARAELHGMGQRMGMRSCQLWGTRTLPGPTAQGWPGGAPSHSSRKGTTCPDNSRMWAKARWGSSSYNHRASGHTLGWAQEVLARQKEQRGPWPGKQGADPNRRGPGILIVQSKPSAWDADLFELPVKTGHGQWLGTQAWNQRDSSPHSLCSPNKPWALSS